MQLSTTNNNNSTVDGDCHPLAVKVTLPASRNPAARLSETTLVLLKIEENCIRLPRSRETNFLSRLIVEKPHHQ